MKQVLYVQGMSCGHCKKAVEQAALGVPGVTEAVVDLELNTLTVMAPAEALPQIRLAVEEEGYQIETH